MFLREAAFVSIAVWFLAAAAAGGDFFICFGMFDSCISCWYALNSPPRSATSVNWQSRSLSAFTDGGQRGRGAGGAGKWGVQCYPAIFGQGLKNRNGGQGKQAWTGGPGGPRGSRVTAPAARSHPVVGDLELLSLHRALCLWFTSATTVECHCSTYMRTSEKIKCYIYFLLGFFLHILVKCHNFRWVIPPAPRCLLCLASPDEVERIMLSRYMSEFRNAV